MEKKIILIIGEADSGKTTKAREIASSYDKKNVTWIDGYTFKKSFLNNFFYSRCDLNTELIIIDGIKDASHIEHFYSHIYEGIQVDKPYKDTFYIYPDLIIIFNEEVSIDDLPTESLAFNRRVSIVKM
jgi:molybdopterin-guanine dinucleotide biosynthesis protein